MLRLLVWHQFGSLAVFFGCIVVVSSQNIGAKLKPNIIFIVADDLGYTDSGFHGGNQIPTPNIDYLAKNGIILDNYYTPMICTPSRASILTGRHPMQLGLQNDVIYVSQPYGLGLGEMLMPEYLRKFGYSTRMVGKWHLGFYRKEYTPTYRGFDSHFGFWGDKTDYFSHENSFNSTLNGLEFWDNLTVADNYNNSYGTILFGNRAVDLIMKHNQSKPFFLYLAHQAVHNGIHPQPLKAPEEYLDKFKFIEHDGRRRYAAMLSVLDDTIGNLTQALKQSGMLQNSIIIFTTDNGGPVDGFSANYASNWPLRGCKYTNWEGGVRSAAFLFMDSLPSGPRVSHQLMHTADWLPTIMSAIGESLPPGRDYYGVDQWASLLYDQPSPRKEIVHNYWNKAGAIRSGSFKLVVCCTNNMNDWYPKQNYIDKNQTAYVNCGTKNSSLPECTKADKYCLYDIISDPCEYNNIAQVLPELAESMYDRLMEYAASAHPPINKPDDPLASPDRYHGHFTDWLDKHPII